MLNIAATLCQSAYRLCFVFTAVIQNVLGFFFVIFWTQLLFPAVGKKRTHCSIWSSSLCRHLKAQMHRRRLFKKTKLFYHINANRHTHCKISAVRPDSFLHPFMLLSLGMKSKVCMCVISSHHNFTSHIHSHVRFPSYLPVHTWSKTNFSLTFI